MNFIDKDDVLNLIEEKFDDDDKILLLKSIGRFEQAHDLYEFLDYDGRLHELIDSSIDIWNYDLRKWSVDNYEYIEIALEEGLLEGVTDFHKLIQMGQCVAAQNEMYEVVQEVFREKNHLLFNKGGEVAS